MANDTKEVLHIVNGEFYAGAERVQDLLALRLPEFGYTVAFICLKDGVFSSQRKAQDTSLYRFPMRSRLDLGPAFRLAELVRTKRYRLIHTHTPRAALVGRFLAALTGLPMIHHVHSPSADDTETRWRNARNALSERITLRRTEKLIPVSNQLEEQLVRRGFKRGRISTVWNGVPTQDRIRLSRESGQPLIVGMVALFRPRKGIEILLRALAALREQGHDVRLHAVGTFESPDYEASVLGLVRALGLTSHVYWRGFTRDVAAEYRKMHVFVLPSLYGEGMPMVVLEAMAAGLPIVGTRIEGIPEVIREGRDGFLVEPASAEALASALARFASNEINGDQFGDSGWHRQREVFSDFAMARGVAEIYDETVGA